MNPNRYDGTDSERIQAAVNAAIEKVLNSGKVTADLKPVGKPATTEDVGKAVCAAL